MDNTKIANIAALAALGLGVFKGPRWLAVAGAAVLVWNHRRLLGLSAS